MPEKHLALMVGKLAKKYGGRTALRYRENGVWQDISWQEADAQIRDAAAYLWSATRGRASPYFAYPFGHHNAFLAREYLPAIGDGVCAAAFTTEPRLVAPDDSRFLLPRFVCGADWRSPDELLARLRGT